jgi:putative transposase
MCIEMKHKTVKRINEPGCFHELTFSCFHKQNSFVNDETCRLFMNALNDAKERHSFKILAYVIMPNHIHLLLCPGSDKDSISRILSGIKLSFSMRFSQLSKERTGKANGIFWQRGGGYDRYIQSKKAIRSSIEYIHANPVRKGLVATPEDWAWSSAKYYAGKSDYQLKMDNELLEVLI